MPYPCILLSSVRPSDTYQNWGRLILGNLWQAKSVFKILQKTSWNNILYSFTYLIIAIHVHKTKQRCVYLIWWSDIYAKLQEHPSKSIYFSDRKKSLMLIFTSASLFYSSFIENFADFLLNCLADYFNERNAFFHFFLVNQVRLFLD